MVETIDIKFGVPLGKAHPERNMGMAVGQGAPKILDLS